MVIADSSEKLLMDGSGVQGSGSPIREAPIGQQYIASPRFDGENRDTAHRSGGARAPPAWRQKSHALAEALL
jgi:hypothetical protein